MIDISAQIEKLNPGQRAAVEAIQGPVLVLAGPGTGKTQVLALRIANILRSTDAGPANILCLTFTESGVIAMRQRLLKMIGNDAYYIRIHTFHSFCNEIIMQFPEKFAFTRDLVQMDDLTRIKIIREIFDGLDKEVKYQLKPFYSPYYYQATIISTIQTLKRESVTPEDLEKIAKENLEELEKNKTLNKRTGKPTGAWTSSYNSALKNLEVADLYAQYQAILQERGLYDYEDMILFVINKMKEDDELLAYYQEKFLYILVDEYQDTNGAQNELLKLLGSFDPSPNIFAVGDDDQAIYRFQGANVENLLFFEKQFENVRTIPITINYRSSQLILDAATSLIKHNKARLVNLIHNISKDLKAGLAIPKRPIQLYEFSSDDIENRFVIDKIKELQSHGASFSDIAIFYRKHSDAEDIAEALLKAGIPIRLAAGRNALDETIVQQFLNLLRVIEFTDRNRDFLMFQVLFYDFFKFNRLDIFKITRFASDIKTPIFDLLTDIEKLKEAKIEDVDKLHAFANKIIQWKADSSNIPILPFVEKVALESGYIEAMFKEQANVEDINAVNSFYTYVKQLNRANRKLTLSEFLKDIILLEENRIKVVEKELNTNREGVNLMTAHKAKGLEYKYIFLIKFYDGNWGGRTNRDVIKLPKEVFKISEKELVEMTDADLESEDERRLTFVALTRAKEQLFISYAKLYPSGNDVKEVSPSQFISEIDSNFVERPETTRYESVDVAGFKTILSHRFIDPYTTSEADYLREVVSKMKLSATYLNSYIECPLKFKFDCLLKVPQVREKGAILGTSVHYVLEHFFKHLKAGEMKDKPYMLTLLKSCLEREILSPEDYTEMFAEGSKILSDYFDQYKDEFITPVEVEFTINGREVVFEPSDSTIQPIPLKGKIDKMEWIDKNSNTVRLIDYKNKSPVSLNAIKGLTKGSNSSIFRQLAFYKLLAECDKFFRPAINLPKYIVDEGEIDFIKPNQRGIFKKERFSIADSDLEVLKSEIINVMTRIRNLEFNGSDEYPLCKKCKYCEIIKK